MCLVKGIGLYVKRGSINVVESVLVDGVFDDDRAALMTTVPSAISARGKGRLAFMKNTSVFT